MKKTIIALGLLLVLVLSACGADVKNAETTETPTIQEAAEKSDNLETSKQAAQKMNEANQQESGIQEEEEKIMAPDFTLLNKAGEEVSLSDYRGKIVFLNFFTTWCKFCDQEMPEFQAASEKYADDVEFLLIDVFTQERVSEDDVYAWYEERNLTMEMLVDVDGTLSKSYPVQAFPTTFFIDRDGSVIAYYPGAMSEAVIDEVVAEFK